MFILATRLPSQWFGGQVSIQAQALEEGNSLDRTVFLILILLACQTLISRGFNWKGIFARNTVLCLFVVYTLCSVLWSDFAFIAFKRWFRDLGNYLVILVILSSPMPLEAIRTVLRRLCYLLLPLSIVLIKYFPQIGRAYDSWTGTTMYLGPTTSKNGLGAICLVSGLFLIWDIVMRWPDRRERATKRILAVNCVFLAMTLWLLSIANSATSRVCLLMACIVIIVSSSRWHRRHPSILKILLPAVFCVYLILAFAFDLNGQFAGAVGRDPTLTDRTLIWKRLREINNSPLLGTGYESFWLGERLKLIWMEFGQINEAHNGFLEVYLNEGMIGLIILAIFILASYWAICRGVALSSGQDSLNLAVWLVVLFYNMTESAFMCHFIWIVFLLATINTGVKRAERVIGVRARKPADGTLLVGASVQGMGVSSFRFG